MLPERSVKMRPPAPKKSKHKLDLSIKIIILGDYSVGKTAIIKQMARRNTVIVKDEYNFEKRISGNNNTSSDNFNQQATQPLCVSPDRHLYTVLEEKSCEVRKAELEAPPPKISSSGRKQGPDPELMSYMHRPGIVEVEFNRGEKTVRALIADTGGQERYRSMTTSYYRGAHGCLLIFDATNEESFENLSGWIDQIDRYKMSTELPMVVVATQCSSPKRCVPTTRGSRFAKEHLSPYVEVDLKNMDDIQLAFEQLVDEVIVALYKKKASSTNIHLKPEIKMQHKCPCS